MIMRKKLQDFKNRDNYFKHLSQLFTLQVSQFEYTGLPDTLPAEYLEIYLLINGTVAIGKVKELDNNDLYCAVGSYNGDYNGYLPNEYTAAVTGLGEISGKWFGSDKTVIVGRNNSIRAPEFDIPFTAGVLTEIDISEDCNVIFTRFMRIPYADNDKQKTQIESAIKSIIKGDKYAVASRDLEKALDNYLNDVKSPADREKFLELVDPDKTNKLQYLAHYRDNVLKRFLNRRGYMMTISSKLAQQTIAELHGSDSYSLLYPIEQLRCRKEMIENINTLFGLSASVDFNPVLKKVYERFMSSDELTKNGYSEKDSKNDSNTEESDNTEQSDNTEYSDNTEGV